MNQSEKLHEAGSRLVRRFGTRDPFAIAQQLGVHVLFCDSFGPLKGMYRVILRNRFIFINRDLDEDMQRIVCAHELGHDCLHRKLACSGPLREFSLYDMTSRPEYEANAVAAAILLDDDEMREYICQYGFSAEELAKVTHTDVNLVALKIEHMNSCGLSLRPQEFRSNFLK